MEEHSTDEYLKSMQEATQREVELAERLVEGFGEMPILERLRYASTTLSNLVQENRGPGRTPMELRVVELVIDQVINILRECPDAAALTESLAEARAECGQIQPQRPTKASAGGEPSSRPQR